MQKYGFYRMGNACVTLQMAGDVGVKCWHVGMEGCGDQWLMGMMRGCGPGLDGRELQSQVGHAVTMEQALANPVAFFQNAVANHPFTKQIVSGWQGLQQRQQEARRTRCGSSLRFFRGFNLTDPLLMALPGAFYCYQGAPGP